jgi:hypothetical protein
MFAGKHSKRKEGKKGRIFNFSARKNMLKGRKNAIVKAEHYTLMAESIYCERVQKREKKLFPFCGKSG